MMEKLVQTCWRKCTRTDGRTDQRTDILTYGTLGGSCYIKDQRKYHLKDNRLKWLRNESIVFFCLRPRPLPSKVPYVRALVYINTYRIALSVLSLITTVSARTQHACEQLSHRNKKYRSNRKHDLTNSWTDRRTDSLGANTYCPPQ